MKSRLAISLSWVGGYVNVLTLFACGAVTSHVTGNITHAIADIPRNARDTAQFAFVLVLAFFFGAILSGVLVETARRQRRRSKYALPIAIEIALLSIFAARLWARGFVLGPTDADRTAVASVAAVALGLQNATITRISGSVVRTTHVTGVVTDLALETVQFAHWCLDRLRAPKRKSVQHARRGRRARLLAVSLRQPGLLRAALLASILASFVFGAAAAAYLYSTAPGPALALPIAFLSWIVFVDWRTPIADVRELDLVSDPALSAAGVSPQLIPPEVAMFRLDCGSSHGRHRAPDFVYWAERLPAEKRILLLSLSPTLKLNEDSAGGLREGAESLRASGRRLLIGGITSAQYRVLSRYGVLRSVPSEDVWPDLEFALAHALAILATGNIPSPRSIA